jgi:hypothetical protein
MQVVSTLIWLAYSKTQVCVSICMSHVLFKMDS